MKDSQSLTWYSSSSSLWTASTWIQVDFMYMGIMELVLMMKHQHNQD
ncbi:MAG: hypothetical protein HRU34_06960 [Richelia sp.]|nr:hypothetical protein [Richelia sp.]